ncbi:unnamed protein product [Candidula unifasciata]|uniref:G-protein coupled receptors family 1 profile domain-containing protein n=1 Tax=Candidula unifasciata TaxID=100452 RepID=A0A8S3ZCX5_9EUPU|nr:unnamed protein product [Candidula unifasciata]
MAEIEDNSIPASERGPVVDTNLGNFDLSDVQEEIDELVRPADDNPASSSMISSLLSSMAATNGALDNAAPEGKLPLSDFTNSDQTSTGLPLTDLPESVTLPFLGDVTFAGDISNIVGSIESLRNSSFLQTTNETIDQSASSWSAEEIGAVAIVSVMVPFILLSNVFVIISVVRFRRLHTPTNYFITSLAAVDIFVALATPFGIMFEVFNFGGVEQAGDAVVCLIPNRVLMMACGVSVLTMATIAYDRHTALVSPLEYINVMTSRKVAIMVSVTWIYAAIIVWLPLMAGWYDLPTSSTPCSSNLIQGKAPILFLSAIFVPSCIAIFVCYFRIFMVARHHAKAIAAVEFAVHRHLQVKFIIKDTKYAKTLALVIGVFLILWLPYLTFVFVRAVSSSAFNKWIQTYLVLLTVFNSGINPWLYAFKNNELRAAFKRLFREFCRSKLCLPVDRRASLISAISGTPRLSRTDSRVASLVPEVTVYTINEKLRKSLEFLDEQNIENKHDGYDNVQRRQTDSAVAPCPYLYVKSALRSAASCSDLDSVKVAGSDSGQPGPRSRSFSVDFTLHDDSFPQDGTDSYEVPKLYLKLEPQDGDPGNNETSDYPCDTVNAHSSPSSPTSPVTRAPLTPSKSISFTPVYLQPPPPVPSSRRSSASSYTATSSVQTSSENAKNLQTPTPTAPLSTDYLPAQQLQQQQQPTHQPLRHTHSLAYVQESFLPNVTWEHYCPENLTDAIFHPFVQLPNNPNHSSSHSSTTHPSSHSSTTHPKDQQILTHTQSCPIFDPITTYNLHYPQIPEHRTTLSHHGKSNPHSNRLDFVSLVNREVENSCNRRYLV